MCTGTAFGAPTWESWLREHERNTERLIADIFDIKK